MPTAAPAFAKLNLILRVGGVRDDGYHPLASWMVTTGLHDTLTLTRREGPFEVTTSDPHLPTDDRNLVTKAANRFVESAGVALDGLHLHVEKRIPLGGGLGGGSSNAAQTLLLLNEALDQPMRRSALTTLAAEIGSDVSFFMHGPSSWCTGRGEIITPIIGPKPRAALLFLPDLAVSTADAYQRFDAQPASPLDEAAPSLYRVPTLELLQQLRNDLETPVFAAYPELAQLRETLEQSVGRPVRMSGSGSTLFTLFDTLSEAEAVAATIDQTRAVAVTLCPTRHQ